MTGYVVRRVAQSVPVLFVVSLIVFLTINVVPGDPVLAIAGAQNSPDTNELIEVLRHQWGLDRPLYVRYFIWVGNLLQGDFGVSYFSQVSVTELIGQRLPATAELAALSLAFALLIAIPTGVLAAVKHGSWLDLVATAFVTMGMAIPGFWLGIMLVLVFAVWLDWLPPLGFVELGEDPARNLRHAVLPAVTLGLILAAPIMRFLRSSMLEVLRQEYVVTARAKGLRERAVVVRHALKNALIPTVTIIGLQFGQLMGGVVIIEWVFGWPGVGGLTINAISLRDYSVLQATVLLVATGFVLVNLLVDLLYAALDPHIRYG